MSDYNGWTNKPTWLINLWVGEGTEEYVREFVASLDGHIQQRADDLKDYIMELFCLDAADAGLQSDLMGWTLSTVDWIELIEAYEDE